MDSEHINQPCIKKLLLLSEEFYRKILHCFKWILFPLRKVYTLFNILKPNVWVITGVEISSRKKLVLIYAGREKEKNYVVKLAFDDTFEKHYIGKVWLWKLQKMAKEGNYDCSLMIVEVHCSFRLFLRKKKCFYIPSWLSGAIDISVNNPSLFKQRNTMIKS